MSDAALELDGVTKRFGGLAAIDHVSLLVRRGRVHAVVGPNGAGKTTLFNLISGFLRPDAGRILLGDRNVTTLPVARRVPLGIVRTFQNIRLFRGLTVRENVWIGQHAHASAGLRSLWPAASKQEAQRRAAADAILDKLGLSPYAERLAAGLPYGIQKRLELARALAAQPIVLLLDEPTAGMNEEESREIMRHLADLRDEGMTILLVEHDMNVVMGSSDIVSVLDFGRLIAEGSPAEVQTDPSVREAYLGSETSGPATGTPA